MNARFTGRGEDRDAHVPVVAEGRETSRDLGVGRVVDRVHGRTVERDRRDVISDLDVKVARGLVAHRVEMYNPLQRGDVRSYTVTRPARGEHS